jgi:hypothetical protein
MTEQKEKLLAEAKRELAKRDRHFGVLLEDIDSKYVLICESLDCFRSMAEETKTELRDFRTETNEKFGIVFNEIDGLKSNVKVLEGGVKQILNEGQEFFDKFRGQ